jgi:hypothetical protein
VPINQHLIESESQLALTLLNQFLVAIIASWQHVQLRHLANAMYKAVEQ